MEKIIILGFGGHAKSVADVIKQEKEYELAGFVDINAVGESYCGHKVIASDDELEGIYRSGIHAAAIGVGFMGERQVRLRLYKRLKEIGYHLPPIGLKKADKALDVQVGEASFIGKGAVLNSSVKLGKLTIINTGAVIEHDCVVGDDSHVAAGAVLCGGVQVGEAALIGANATVIQNVCVGKQCIIGAGAVVIRDLQDGVKAVGNPAREIR